MLTIQSEGEAAIARGRYVDSNLAKLIRLVGDKSYHETVCRVCTWAGVVIIKVYCISYGVMIIKVYCISDGVVIIKVYCIFYGVVIIKAYCISDGVVIIKVYCISNWCSDHQGVLYI